MAIAIAKEKDKPTNFVNGYAEKELLPGTHPLVRGYKCILKKKSFHSPLMYKDKTVVFIFSKGKGYITNSEKAYNIEGVCFFIPDFDSDQYTIYAAEDMEYMMVITDMIPSDIEAYKNTHIILPLFKKLSDCDQYTQTCKGPHTQSWSVVHSGNLARVLIGVVKADGEGTTEKGHPAVDQWNYCLPGADFHLTVEDETINTEEGDWSFVPAGLDHSLLSDKGKSVFYVWFEHKTAKLK